MDRLGWASHLVWGTQDLVGVLGEKSILKQSNERRILIKDKINKYSNKTGRENVVWIN